MECLDPMMELLIDLDKISENGRNIYEWNQINQTILEIDIDWTSLNEPNSLTYWRFGISKSHQYSIFRNTFQCHWTRKAEIKSSRIDGCQIWKIYILSFSIISSLLRIINEHDSSNILPARVLIQSVMDCNDGRSIQIISF